MKKGTTLQISGKVSDLCVTTLLDEKGEVLKEHDGYVPKFMPENGGDYIYLEIDIETGKILNWITPTQERLKEFIKTGK